MSVRATGASALSRIAVACANLIALAALMSVIAFWGWRWFGPAPVHIPPAPLEDRAAAFAVSPPFGVPAGPREPVAPPIAVAGEVRLLGVLAEREGKGRALFRFADGSARLVTAGESLSTGATLVAVRQDGVTISDGSGQRDIALRGPSASGTPSPRASAGVPRACALPAGYKGPVVKLNAELVQGFLAQPESLRAVVEAGEGALVVRDEAGFAALLGMRKGDRMTQANGIALRAPEDLIVAVLRPLAASQPVRIVGSRGAEARELVILNASTCPG